MKNVISFSGGRTSAYLCHLAKQGLIEDPAFVFCDTGAEHPATYDFVRKCNDYFELNLVCLRVDINHALGEGNSYKVIQIQDIKQDLEPFKAMMAKYGTPYNPSGGFCTEMLKSKPFDAYCDDMYGKGNTQIWLGMRIDEPKRLTYLKPKQQDLIGIEEKVNKRNIRYLAEISDFDKQDVLDWWDTMPFDLEIPEPLGNCVFCIKKGANKIAIAERFEPEMAKDFIAAVKDESVRITDRAAPSYVMYRDGNSIESIIRMYKDFTTEEIEKTIQSMRQYDAGSCSESCEAFSDNYDFFED